MTSSRWLTLPFLGMVLVACGGGVSLGNTGQDLTKGDGGTGSDAGVDKNGRKLCDPSECNDSGFACATGPATNLRCVRGEPGGSAGPNGICMLDGDCPPAGDPCLGTTLPTCPRECDTFPATGTCSAGDACRLHGSTIGDECSCTGGAWQCTPHGPLSPNTCNQVCKAASDPCAGVSLPTCARECAQFPELGACMTGDACRAMGSKIGDDCTCGAANTWECTIHRPVGMGCNLTCR